MHTVPALDDEIETTSHDDSSLPRSHLCVNCGVDTRRLKRFTLNNAEVRSIIQQWNTPVQISANSLVCYECLNLARKAPHSAPQERTAGHRKVCANCGQSVLRKRFHQLNCDDEGTRDTQVRNIIAEWIIPRQLTSSPLVCHPCWQRATRAISKSTPATTIKAPQGGHKDKESYSTKELEIEHSGGTVNEDSKPTIFLPNYTRAPITEQFCFYPQCSRPERLTVPAYLRARLFTDFNYYVSSKNRICQYHMLNTFGNELTEVEQPIHTFTAAQIEDFTDLLKHLRSVYLDFENIENMDSTLADYWFGLSIDDILKILREVPRLSTMHRGKLALAAYLIKLRTGQSDQRISLLLNIPRSTLERLMGKVREILNQEFVLHEHLGFNLISRDEMSS